MKSRKTCSLRARRRYWMDQLERRLLLSGSPITLTIPSNTNTLQGGTLVVPVLVNSLTDGVGDVGLSQANFAINYNASKLSSPNVFDGTAAVGAGSLFDIETTLGSGELGVYIVGEPLSIASVVGSGGSSDILVNTVNPLPVGLNSLDEVHITGVNGFSQANGTFDIKVTGTYTFTLDNTAGITGSANSDTGTASPAIEGGSPGATNGANNDSIVVIDFNVLSNAATGGTSINLVSSNSLGSTFADAADGVGYGLTLNSGSANILPLSSTPNLGNFAAVSKLTLSGNPGIGTMLLLTDGSILAQGGFDNPSNQWFRLIPDASGNYSDGTWHQLANSNVGRLFYGSVVLPDGDVMVLGGEDTNQKGVSETNTGEIFTPPTTPTGMGSWQSIKPFPQSSFGDGNLELLSDGTVLASSGAAAYRYTPSLDPLTNPGLPANSNPWTPDAVLSNNLTNAETAWTKLPDGSILSYQLYSFADDSPETAGRLVFGSSPSQDQWVNAGTVEVPLGASGGAGLVQELGPGFLLPDGQVFEIGANGNTALYTTPEVDGNIMGSWVAGPVIPNGEGAADAPGAMMPNGDVLFAVSPYMTNGIGSPPPFNTPTSLDEYNPTTNTISVVPPDNSGGNPISDLQTQLNNVSCFRSRMLDLPNGQIMFTDQTGIAYVYSPNSSPNGVATPLAAWQPTITNITPAIFGFYELTGTQLNGISEGAGYGDDAQMATNYPIVRLENQYGVVSYATTSEWSSDGVATGDTSETAFFTLPSGDVPGAYVVNVIANGIASAGTLMVFMGGATSANLVADSNPAYLDVDLAGTTTSVFNLASPVAPVSQVIVDGVDAVSQSIELNYNFGGRNIVVNTGDLTNIDNVTVDVDQTDAVTTIYGGAGNDTFELGENNQNLSLISSVYIVAGTGVSNVYAYDNKYTSSATYTIAQGVISRTSSGSFVFFGNYQSVHLVTGDANDTVDILATIAGTPFYLNAAGGDDTVNIGDAGSLSQILAPIYVSNTPAFSSVVINDSADTAAYGFVQISSTSVTGLAPAAINWTITDVSAITVDGGSGPIEYYITGGGNFTTTVNTGSNTDSIALETNVNGNFVINGHGGSDGVNVIDENSTTQTYTITSTGLTRAGLAVTVTGIDAFTLNAGDGANTVDIESLPCALYVYGDSGTDTYNVTDASILPYLADGLTLVGGLGAGGTTLTFNDSAGNFISEPTITSNEVYAGGGITNYSQISTLVYDLAPYSNEVFLTSTDEVTDYDINGGAGSDTLDLGDGNLANVTSFTTFDEGGITFNPGGGTNELLIDDSEAGAGRSYAFSTGAMTIAGQLNLTYSGGLGSIVLDASSGNNTFAVSGTETFCDLIVNAGNGTDSMTVTNDSLLAPITFNAGGGTDVVTVDPPGGLLYNMDSPVNVYGSTGSAAVIINNVISSENIPVTSSTVGSGIVSDSVNYAGLSSLTLNFNSGSGNDTVNVTSTAAGTPVYINNNGGTDTINVTSTAATGPVILTPSTIGVTDPVNISSSGSSAKVIFQGNQVIGNLTIGNNGTATLSTALESNLIAGGLSLSGTGTLDITDNVFKVDYGSDPIATLRGYLKSAYNGGVWTGAGLTSTTVEGEVANAIVHGGGLYAIGYADGSKDAGQSIALGNQIVFEATIVGDTDLNGDTNFLDLGRVAQNLGLINSDWYHGDFNYDGTTNFLDIGLLAQNLNKTILNTPLGAEVPVEAGAVATPTPAAAPVKVAAPIQAALKPNPGQNFMPAVIIGIWTPAAASPPNLMFGDNQLQDILA